MLITRKFAFRIQYTIADNLKKKKKNPKKKPCLSSPIRKNENTRRAWKCRQRCICYTGDIGKQNIFCRPQKKKKQKTDTYKTDNTSCMNVIVIDTKLLLRKFEFCQIYSSRKFFTRSNQSKLFMSIIFKMEQVCNKS